MCHLQSMKSTLKIVLVAHIFMFLCAICIFYVPLELFFFMSISSSASRWHIRVFLSLFYHINMVKVRTDGDRGEMVSRCVGPNKKGEAPRCRHSHRDPTSLSSRPRSRKVGNAGMMSQGKGTDQVLQIHKNKQKSNA